MKIKLFNASGLFGPRALHRIMRAFVFLFCTAIFALSPNKGNSQNAWIEIASDRDVSVQEIFGMIRNQTDFTFVYNEKHLADAPKITLKKGNIRVNQLLKMGLNPIECAYEFSDNTIIVKKLTRNNAEISTQETFTIKGMITGVDGVPIVGATVYVSDSNPNETRSEGDFFIRGTSADFDGEFELEVSEGQWLIVTAVGFEFYSQQITSRQEEYQIELKVYASELAEIVVVGYGTQRRAEVSSAISSVKQEKVVANIGSNTSFDRGLGGLIKGVQVIQGSGQPGSGVDINIRGITSPFTGADNNPLFVIDGVPFQTNPTFSFNDDLIRNDIPNPLLAINPNDIESIDVLKDASATAIYGSRGANGVIIVNTKKAKKGELLNVSVSAVSTFAKPIGKPDYLNAAQYKARATQLFENSVAFSNQNSALSPFSISSFSFMANLPIDFSTFTIAFDGLVDDWFGDADTDWVDLAYREPAFTQQYNASISGGSANTSYGFSLGYTDQEGLLPEDELKQYNFRANMDMRINDVISTGFNANISYVDNQTGYDDQNSDLNSNILSARPDIAPFDDQGDFNRLPGRLFGFFDTFAANPLALTRGFNYNTESVSLLGNVYTEFRLFDGFKLRGDVNVGRFSSDFENFSPASVTSGVTPDFGAFGVPGESTLNIASTTNTNIITNLTADYSKTFAEKHSVSALLGYAWDRSYADRSNRTFQGFPDDEVLISETFAGRLFSSSQDEIETGLNSLFSRLSYNYSEKYFLTLNFRTDRSARFGPGNQRAYFPSAAASWNISKEEFLTNSKFVNNLRLRAGYGRTGSNNIGDFLFEQFWRVGAFGNRLYSGNIAVGLNGTLPNENIQWETTDELNVGLDFALLKNRLRGSFDYYDRETTGALMGGLFALESGASSFTENFADLTNEGFEIDLFGDVVKTKDINWTLGLNLAKNTNTLERFNGDALSSFLQRFYEVGREVNIITGYVADGFFQTQEELDALNAAAPDGLYQEAGTAPGDYKYVDLDGDGEITADDQEYLGSAQADFFGGFNSVFSYKAFDLSANFIFSVGGEAAVDADVFGGGLVGDPTQNVETRYLDTWTPDNPNARYPRAIIDDSRLNNNIRRSSALLYDTSYLRMQSLQLRYNFPEELLKHLGLNRASLALTGNNLWTMSDFPGIDPVSIGGFAGITSGGTRDPYPIAKSWSLGLNINF